MTTYTTIQGDTWDGIAYKVYGTESQMAELMRANPAHISTVIFSAGVTLIIPPMPANVSDGLPPWKRGDDE
ncbi:LysM domain-containing protein [Paenibacillus dendritiformis]|uniref:tail protein X n=1 Tax=Paenibacillus dendritiformis TaxID=130049 RepID=UPI0010599309|nr:LysM domain-containing protein [Paenibacillus dendritiformis]TDL50951.1 LysM domain-containing protein [Paenibacillus dendritiformis]